MTFLELANKRESCRAYKDIPVERDRITACIEAARLAPSACNSQPWRFVVVDDREKSRALASLLQDKVININKYTVNVPVFIVAVEADAKLSSKLGGRFSNQHFAQNDIGLAAENICLEAAEQGLGSCIIGWFDEKEIGSLLEIPADKPIRLIIALGYPETDNIRKKVRKNIDEILSFNKF
jgi:nitroreductase